MKHQVFNFQTADGLSLYAQSWETDAKPRAVICLVHGLGEHSGRYAHVGEFFNRAGISVFSFDLRGHGRSPGPKGHSPSFEMLMSDIALFLAEITRSCPQSPIILYGHSMAGSLVINFVLRQPSTVIGVIATSPSLRISFKPPAWKLMLGKILYDIIPGFTMTNEVVREHLSRVPRIVDAYNKDPLVHKWVSVRMALDVLQAGEWAFEHASDFPLPLLLMHGSEDKITSFPTSQQFAQALNGRCKFFLWEGLYHELHNEPEQDMVFSYMLDWLNERLA